MAFQKGHRYTVEDHLGGLGQERGKVIGAHGALEECLRC